MNRIAERYLAHEPISDEVVRFPSSAILDAAVGNDDVVPFVTQAERKSKTSEMAGGYDKTHAGRHERRGWAVTVRLTAPPPRYPAAP